MLIWDFMFLYRLIFAILKLSSFDCVILCTFNTAKIVRIALNKNILRIEISEIGADSKVILLIQ